MFKSDRYAASSPAGGELRLRQIFGFVVAALDIEIRASQFNGLQRHFVRKDNDKINGFKCGQHSCTICLRIDRAVVAFAEQLHGSITVHGDNETSA